jgi:hypothetical protein
MRRALPIVCLLWGLGTSFFPPATAQPVGSDKCEDERVSPNLRVKGAIEIGGIVYDASGATFSQIILQIRDPRDPKVMMSAPVDEKGAFHFGVVPRGDFRLVPVKIVNNKTTRVPGFDPPSGLLCANSHACQLKIVLPVRPTDLLYASCPPK